MREFTQDDLAYIADLPNHAGWSLFRDLVQSTHDHLLNSLATAPTDEVQKRVYDEWKAYRTLLGNMMNIDIWANELMQRQAELSQIESQQAQGVHQTPETRITGAEHAQMMQHLRPQPQPPAKQLMPLS